MFIYQRVPYFQTYKSHPKPILQRLLLSCFGFRLPLPRFVELSHCIPQLLHGFLLLLGPAASVAPGLMAILIGKMDENGSFKPVDFGVPHSQKSHRAPVECKLQRRLLPAEWLLVECPAQRYWSGPASPAGLRNWLWHLCHFLCFKVKPFDMSKTIRGCEICCVMLIHPEDFKGLAYSWTEIQNGLAQWSSRPLSFAFCTVTGNFLGVARESQTALFVTKWRYLGLAKLVEIWPFETWWWRKLPLA